MSSKLHHFNIELASSIGVEKAIIMCNLEFWLDWSKANNRNVHEGYHWTFNSASAFASLFPYWTANKIQKTLKRMEDDGLIITGSFNKKGYDRTKWYTTSEYAIQPNGLMQSADSLNAISQMAEPIPNINPNINTNVITKDIALKETSAIDNYQDGFVIFYNAGLRKKDPKGTAAKFKALAKKMKADPIELAELLKTNIQARLASKEFGFDRLHPSTYLNKERWNDELDSTDNGFSAQAGKQTISERILHESGHGQTMQSESDTGLVGNGGAIRGTVGQGTRFVTIGSMDSRNEQARRIYDQDGFKSDS